MKLSIIIPVFNEEETVAKVLEAVAAVSFGKVKKEVIIVDDGSTDNTANEVNNFLKNKKPNDFFFYQQVKNQGKGAAVKTGIEKATGEYIIIQDADLEYDPRQIAHLLVPIIEGKAKVVYGTRLTKFPRLTGKEPGYFVPHFLGNRFLSLVTSIIYGRWITDMETCYKLFPKDAMKKISLRARGFELEPEITAKLLKQNLHFREVPITTKPRGYEEGKSS